MAKTKKKAKKQTGRVYHGAEANEKMQSKFAATRDPEAIETTFFYVFPLKHKRYKIAYFVKPGHNPNPREYTTTDPLNAKQKQLVGKVTKGLMDMTMVEVVLRSNTNLTEADMAGLTWREIMYYMVNIGCEQDDGKAESEKNFPKWITAAELCPHTRFNGNLKGFRVELNRWWNKDDSCRKELSNGGGRGGDKYVYDSKRTFERYKER